MKKRLGDFTLDEINAECRKHRECKNCPFQYGEERCQIKQFLKHVYADFGDDEIELPEPKPNNYEVVAYTDIPYFEGEYA